MFEHVESSYEGISDFPAKEKSKNSVTSKKSPNANKRCPKMISLEK